jgi:hypothetical protein
MFHPAILPLGIYLEEDIFARRRHYHVDATEDKVQVLQEGPQLALDLTREVVRFVRNVEQVRA